MFTALSKVFDFFWTTEEEEQEENLGNSFGDDTVSTSKSRHDNDLEKGQDNYVASNEESLNIKNINGTVTHLFATHGLIDNDVYFSFEDVLNEKIPKVGDKVNATAKRKHVHSGWYASKVAIDTDQEWDCRDEDEPKLDSIIGIITDLKNGDGMINNDIRLTGESFTEDYSPRVGDYVTADVHNEEDSVWGSNVKPLRTVEKEAMVTSVQMGHGYIEEDIFFAFDSCQEGYRPRRWDKVKVIAIESGQGKSKWRAVSVQPAKAKQIPR